MAHGADRDPVLETLVIARLQSERGTTLLETMLAMTILLVVMSGLLSLGGLAATTTENNGHLAARTTEDAQDKMEQLLVLAYTNNSTDTTVFPATATGGTGLAVGGSANPVTPVNGYVDWIAADGSLLGGGATPPVGWFYKRVWQITNATATVKEIRVTVTTSWAFSKVAPPKSTVVALKSSQF
jgi:hypothetical protein